MKKGTHWKQVNEKRFGEVKKLLGMGIKRVLVCKIVGLSYATVMRIDKTKDFVAYKKPIVPVMPKNDSVVPFPEVENKSGVTTAVTRRLDRVIELLEEIRDKKIKLF